MYTLKVKVSFAHPDGRIFEVGHDCKSLNVFEAAELAYNYPQNFEAGDEMTADLLGDEAKLKHYAGVQKGA